MERKFKMSHRLIVVFMSAVSLAMMYPFVWMLLTSFKSNAELRANRTKFWPENFTLEGYVSAFHRAPIDQWFLNSIIVTALVTISVIITSTLIGYIFAKYEFKGKRIFFWILLGTMMVPPQVP